MTFPIAIISSRDNTRPDIALIRNPECHLEKACLYVESPFVIFASKRVGAIPNINESLADLLKLRTTFARSDKSLNQSIILYHNIPLFPLNTTLHFHFHFLYYKAFHSISNLTNHQMLVHPHWKGKHTRNLT